MANRVAVGWRKFWAMRQLLMSHGFSLKKRLELFESTVSGTILWASESWTPRAEELKRLQATQNAMLRTIVNVRRADEETYIDWIVRSTHKAREIAVSAGATLWAQAHFWKKWRWAGHVARMTWDQWVPKVTRWRDAASGRLGIDLKRPTCRRWMKFEDPLRRWGALHGVEDWQAFAKDREDWKDAAADFVRWACKTESE